MSAHTARWAICRPLNMSLAAPPERNGAERCATPMAPRPAPLLHRARWLKCHRDSPHRWMKLGAQVTSTDAYEISDLFVLDGRIAPPPTALAITDGTSAVAWSGVSSVQRTGAERTFQYTANAHRVGADVEGDRLLSHCAL